jgi:hypothetical protein
LNARRATKYCRAWPLRRIGKSANGDGCASTNSFRIIMGPNSENLISTPRFVPTNRMTSSASANRREPDPCAWKHVGIGLFPDVDFR